MSHPDYLRQEEAAYARAEAADWAAGMAPPDYDWESLQDMIDNETEETEYVE